MAQADEDDFFGIKQLESKPLPEFYHRSNATTQSAPVNVKSKQPKLDPFEENFFPELAERYEQENVEEDMAADQAEEVGFFEEHFARKGNPEQITEQKILDQFRLNHDESTVDIFEQLPEKQKRGGGGITELWSKIDPIWKMESEDLIDFMAERVIHENDDFIALDKPFQMTYASGPSDQAQLDRILHNLKKRIAPHIDRLHLVNSLEKWCSGVLLFAKNTSAKEQMKSQLNDDNFIFRFRCLVKNIPKVDKARISIPLIKVKQNQDIKLCPLFGRASSKKQLYHLNTDWKLVNSCSQGQVSLLDAFIRRGNAQVVRSHLYYGLDCPLVGDQKYVRADLAPESKLNNKLNPWAMDALNLSNNSLRRMPVFMHLAEVHVPNGGGVAAADNFSVVRAQLPTFYSFALKKLSLLRR